MAVRIIRKSPLAAEVTASQPKPSVVSVKGPPDSPALVRVARLCSRAAKWMAAPLTTTSKTSRGASPEEVRNFLLVVERHQRELRKLFRRARTSSPAVLKHVAEHVATSFSGRICAVLREARDQGERLTFAAAEQRAHELELKALDTEPVIVHARTKDDGTFRPIVRCGWRRRCLQILLRDVFYALGIESEFEFAKKFQGPGRAAECIKKAIEGGYRFWFVCDVKDFYPSLKPEHFEWIPVRKSLLTQGSFLPKCVPVLCETSLTGPTEHALRNAARQGLAQGAMASPLLASALLGRILRELTGSIVVFIHGDDISIGARTEEEARTVAQGLQKRLAKLSAGPLFLRTEKIYDAHEFMEFMQFRLRRKFFLGEDEGVHRRPSTMAFRRFEKELARRIVAYPEGFDMNVIVEELQAYGRSWIGGIQWLPPGSPPDRVELVHTSVDLKIEVMVSDMLLHGLPAPVAGKIYGWEGVEPEDQ